MDKQESIREAVTRIADSLERIEKALPGCGQEVLEGIIKETIISLLSSERTHLEYR